MSGDLTLAIDQGTTNTKAIAVNGAGAIVASAAMPMEVHYPQPGWAEQSADAIWETVRQVIARIVAEVGAERIATLAISNQRESIIVWDAATSRPIGPCVIWQCRRSAERCAAIRAAGHAEDIAARTGLPLDPLFPAAKIAWLLDDVPGARAAADRGELRAGTVDAWLLWNLTAGAVHATDHSNASRTQLFNTEALAWDPRLCDLFEVPLHILPQVRPSDSHFGDVAGGVTALRPGTPIRSMMGDSHAALYGHGVRGPGLVKATYGTGTSLMTLTPTRPASRHGLAGTIAWSTAAGVVYALEGNIAVSGQAAAFMAEMLGLPDAAALALLAESVPDSNGVVFVPALVGLGAPHWQAEARGLVSGLSLGTRPAHLARAAVEAIAFQVTDVYRAMEADLAAPLSGLSADGGASRNGMLMRLQADLLGAPVRRSHVAEVSALGAAAMAGAPLVGGQPDIFAPAGDAAWRAHEHARWTAAIARTLL